MCAFFPRSSLRLALKGLGVLKCEHVLRICAGLKGGAPGLPGRHFMGSSCAIDLQYWNHPEPQHKSTASNQINGNFPR